MRGRSMAATVAALCLAAPAWAEGYCERQKDVETGLLAALAGRYDIVGRWPDSDTAYTGQVEFELGSDAYALRRTVAGTTTKGEAWIERCSPDKFMVLVFRFAQAAKPFGGHCYLRTDGDNYFLLSCFTSFESVESRRVGLEAMFQRHEP